MSVFREHRPRVQSMISLIIQLNRVLNGSGGGLGRCIPQGPSCKSSG